MGTSLGNVSVAGSKITYSDNGVKVVIDTKTGNVTGSLTGADSSTTINIKDGVVGGTQQLSIPGTNFKMTYSTGGKGSFSYGLGELAGKISYNTNTGEVGSVKIDLGRPSIVGATVEFSPTQFSNGEIKFKAETIIKIGNKDVYSTSKDVSINGMDILDFLSPAFGERARQLKNLPTRPELDVFTWTSDFGGAESTTSPLVLDLNGDGVQTTRLSNSFTQGVHFNLDATGLAENTAWVDAQDGLLVRDLNGDGQISSGRELFGNHTLLHNGARAANGFEALKELDNNADGVVDANDALFASLKVWKDTNSDGVTDAGELLTLAQAGVKSFNVSYTSSDSADANGNQHRQQGNYTTTDDSTQYERRVVCSRHRPHGRHRAGNGERSHCTTAQLSQHGQPAQLAPSHGARQLGDAASTAPPTPPMRTKKAFCSVVQPCF